MKKKILLTAFYAGETDFQRYCETTIASVKTIALVLLFLCVILYIFHTVKAFYEQNYLFYKSIGMYAPKIFVCLLEKERYKILILCGSYALFLLGDSILTTALQMLWFLLCFFCVYALVYVSWHWKPLLSVIKAVAYFYGFLLLFSIFLNMCDDMVKPRIWAHTNTFILVSHNGMVKDMAEFLLHPSGISVMTVSVLSAGAWFLILKSDKKIAQVGTTESPGKSRRKHLLHTKKNPGIYFFNHMAKEFSQCFRKKENLFCYLFLYGCYGLLIWQFEHGESVFFDSNILFDCALFFISFFSVMLECFYHGDSKLRKWYTLFGESYGKFLVKKMVLSLAVVGMVPMAGILAFPGVHLWQAVLILYFLGSVLYWNLYFGSYYTKMGESETIVEILRIFVVWMFFYIPVFHAALCLFWYKKGKREWDRIA
ncbi:MAG: hypothetical protein NC307_09680 [Roseburia sp.]|nr:hypothetical protein [Roseburia sp.]